MYRAIRANKRNTVLLMIGFVAFTAGLGWLAAQIFGDPQFFWVTVVVALGYTVVQYFLAGSQALSMSGAVRVDRTTEPRLFRIVENLAITTGSPMPAVYVIDDHAPNAFAIGRDPSRASVAATTGLLELLTDAELEGVMAHELGHVRNYDTRVSLVVFGLVVAISLLSDLFLRMAFWGRRDNAQNNPALMLLGVGSLLLAPLVATVVQLAISRQREYLADATGAFTTRHPEALASALHKISQHGRPVARQHSSMAHFWIANPLAGGAMSRLFATHPPTASRIRRLLDSGTHF